MVRLFLVLSAFVFIYIFFSLGLPFITAKIFKIKAYGIIILCALAAAFLSVASLFLIGVKLKYDFSLYVAAAILVMHLLTAWVFNLTQNNLKYWKSALIFFGTCLVNIFLFAYIIPVLTMPGLFMPLSDGLRVVGS